YAAPGGELPRPGEGEAEVRYCGIRSLTVAARFGAEQGVSWYYLPFRLRLMRLTISLAVRSMSFGVPVLAGSYTDQTTTRDLASTRKTVPLERPNDELLAGFASLFTVSPSNGPTSSPVFSGFGAGSGFSLSGVGKISSSFIWKLSPIWS